jgi:hypothetical protein
MDAFFLRQAKHFKWRTYLTVPGRADRDQFDPEGLMCQLGPRRGSDPATMSAVDRVSEKRSMSGWISLVASFLTRRTQPPPRPHSVKRDRSAELRDFEAAQQRQVIIHPSVTLPRVRAAMERSSRSAEDVRFCIVCGVQHTQDAPAIWHLHCKACGAYAVYGANELLFSLAGELKSVDERR